ncbi:GTPase-activating protein [Oleoguttula sp. CCFEE 5521]
MSALIRDTAFGQLVRLLTRKRIFQYDEERTDVPSPYDSANVIEKNEYPSRAPDSDSTDLPELEKHANENLVDWYGPNDPENPMNWSTAKKFLVTAEICLLTVSIYSGSSIYAPAVESVSETFGVSTVAAILGLTLFVLGYGLGPMIWSPMSEVPYIGRMPVYIATLAVFVALQGPTARSSSFGMLMVMRFLTGFFGSPVLATGGATCADLYTPAKRTYAIAIWGVAAVCGPALGPVIGGYVTEYGPITSTFRASWEWPIYTLMWIGGACLIVLFFALPETSASNILFRRASRLRARTGNSKLMSKPEIDAQAMSTRDILNMTLIHPFTLNFTEPMVFLLNLYIALIYGLLYIWFESFPIVFIGMHGFTLGQLGLAYLGLLVGALVIVPPFFWWMHRYLEPQFDENGEIYPEKRLIPCFVGAFFIPICLFWFGWSSSPDIHWIMPIIGSAWFSMGAFLLFMAILNYLPDAYPNHIPSVLAGNDLMRASFGAGFPLFANAFYTKLGVGWASSVLAFISIAFIPIPFVLYKASPSVPDH